MMIFRIKEDKILIEEVDKSKIKVTMTVADYEYYTNAVEIRDYCAGVIKRANVGGEAVMTEELKAAIEAVNS